MSINDSDEPPASSTAMAAINRHNTETNCYIHYSIKKSYEMKTSSRNPKTSR